MGNTNFSGGAGGSWVWRKGHHCQTRERRDNARRTETSPNANVGLCRRKAHLFLQKSLPALLGSAEHWAYRAQLSAAPPRSSSAPHVLAVGLIHPFISSVSLRTSEWQRMPQAFLIKLVPFHNTFFVIFLNTYGMKNKIALHFPKEDLK